MCTSFKFVLTKLSKKNCFSDIFNHKEIIWVGAKILCASCPVYNFAACTHSLALRKLAHAIYRDFCSHKNENFQQKFFAQNIRSRSNEYPQCMFWRKNKKNRYTTANPSFAIYKWGIRGYTFHRHVFLM